MSDPTSTSAGDISLRQILADGVDFAQAAGKTARTYFRQHNAVEFKEDESPVTVIDQRIEQELKTAISAKYPLDGIFGEESGVDGGLDGNLWVIDPIDGTRSFISGNPLFGMLLSYVQNGAPVAGLISMPMLDEIYCGAVGQDATCNGAPISVSNQRSIDDCTLYINEGEKLIAEHPERLSRLLMAGKTRRFGYDCYPHALLAAGHIDAVVDYDLKPYDYLALSAVITAAGGIMTDWQGKPLDLNSGGAVVAAATPELHHSLLALLKE
ncbi:inositol monophosphatase family protein [Neptunicoccus cionae]|uniref:Histidinol phosphate phosphatase n=1 Tax=Neptunicoccus cionae TaxID=2035344 RepID=A0A916VS61_9RHOB|nr:inositol monophosphatase family protein [Amylibacter cionae]GGA27591.1 histidinol phosphate phosphatase [Amylibacter cionae]